MAMGPWLLKSGVLPKSSKQSLGHCNGAVVAEEWVRGQEVQSRARAIERDLWLLKTKLLAHNKATALLQTMLQCSPGPCEAGVFASIVDGYSGVFGGI